MVVIRRTIVLFAVVALAGCSNGSDPTPPTTTSTSTTRVEERASVEATYGCGPADGAEVRVSGRAVGHDEVVIEVVFDDTVYDRSWPMTGPKVGVLFETKLPQAAFDAGSADVRIVRADDRASVVASGAVRLDLSGSCG